MTEPQEEKESKLNWNIDDYIKQNLSVLRSVNFYFGEYKNGISFILSLK